MKKIKGKLFKIKRDKRTQIILKELNFKTILRMQRRKKNIKSLNQKEKRNWRNYSNNKKKEN